MLGIGQDYSIKKYRKVYDKSEINYISVPLELYNKLFDEEDCELAITFKLIVKRAVKNTKNNVLKRKNIPFRKVKI